MTFQEMMESDHPDYQAARTIKVAEIAAIIEPVLCRGLSATSIAADIVSNIEAGNGRINGDDVYFELPARYTAAGNALPYTI